MEAAHLDDLGGGRFALTGNLVFDTVPALVAEGDAALGAVAHADVDLAGVGRVDSAGLALLLEWVVRARAAGRAVRYRHAPAALVTLAGIGEVDGLLDTASGG